MLDKLKKSENEGFTIIEVMIVLAIAGLILLIVFLAVPALQRNARNTQRKNDIGALTGAISEFTNNNNGTPPSTQALLATAVGNAHLGSYTSANVFYQPTESSAPTQVTGPATNDNTHLTTDDVIVVANATCNGSALAAGTSSRNMALIYAVESSAGNGTYECSVIQ